MLKSDFLTSFFRRRRTAVLIAAAVAFWVAGPFLIKVITPTTAAQTVVGPSLVAALSGTPTGTTVPTGAAAYTTVTIGGVTARNLRVEVFGIDGPAGTSLAVFLNSANIGSIMLDLNHHGMLNLSTGNGNSVPNVVAGDTLSVKNGATTVLSGIFAPAATPTPTATPPPDLVRYWAPLTGPAIDGITPRGIGHYESWGANRRMDVFVAYVNLPDNTMLSLMIDGANTGPIVLRMRQGAYHCGYAATTPCPVVNNGSTVVVKNGNTTVLSGVFSNAPLPTPSPTVTPTPRPATLFGAKLTGAKEVPPVVSEGRGFGLINIVPSPAAASTDIAVRLGYCHLSSNATAVTINGPAMPDANGPVIFTLTHPGGTCGRIDVQRLTITPEQLMQLRAGLWYFNVATQDHTSGEIRGQIRSVNARTDFDGDGISDVSVVRASSGLAPDNAANSWYILNSSDNTLGYAAIGQPGDINVQGDYDGDGIADVAMFTPSTGNWQIRMSDTGMTANYRFGASGDVPVVGDFDGDGLNDLAVFRPSEGNWYIRRSTDGGCTILHWGQMGDRPVSGDFDGDGSNDIAVFRPSLGNWYILRSSDNGYVIMHWGLNGDRPVAGDFDGDGTSDIGVYRPSEGTWYIYKSSDGGFMGYRFGLAGDVPVPCEFDGDGTTDIAVFRPSDGNWYILRSSDNSFVVERFGLSGDLPLQTAYTP